ncbi:MAG: TIGR02281 family clan AA aspartic protease [Gammaproteobacteria bacterium]|nr:TIGR02281 family clan AA aspartic protease [Gammaproteobacteria bacterium]
MNRKHWLGLILLFSIWLPFANLSAAVSFRVVALFNGKAMLQIEGKNHLLRAGQQGPHGLLLISADSSRAVIEVDGQRESYGLGRHVGGGFVRKEQLEVTILRDPRGAYLITGSINGRSTEMLVDTGATSVALSEVEARRLGLDYRVSGRKSRVRTASGVAPAYSLMLDRVRVGEIELRNVEGVVIQGNSPHRVLLGMSFLTRVEMDNQGAILVLRSQF